MVLQNTNIRIIHRNKIRNMKEYYSNVKIKTIPQINFKNAKELEMEVKDFFYEDDLIKELKDKISFTIDEEKNAKNILKNMNYYRFSIYPKLLPTLEGNQKFSFTDSLNLYKFDEFLRKNLSIFLGYIERKWRGSLIYSLCEQYKDIEDSKYYTSQCYLDSEIYSKKKFMEKTLLKFQYIINESNSPAIEHHLKNKNSFIPIWVLFEELTFGQFTNFLNGLKRKYVKSYLESYYDTEYLAAFRSWTSHLVELRNKVSHHSRLYGTYFTKKPVILDKNKIDFFGEATEEDLKSIKNSLVASFYILHSLLIFENEEIKSSWNEFLSNLNLKIKQLDNILDIEKHLGFKNNWLDIYSIDL